MFVWPAELETVIGDLPHMSRQGIKLKTQSSDDFVLEAVGLSKQFAGFYAVREVDLKVRRGSIHALIGPNGAGKTTMFNLLTKFLQPTAGRILCNGEDITNAAPAAIARRGTVRSFQISAIFPHMSVMENVRMALQRATGTSFHFWKSDSSLFSLHERAMELLQSVGLADQSALRAADLPYGRKRALEFATTIALDPKILLLDEPMAGLGREDIARITTLIRSLAQNRTVLMVEHNLSVVSDLSDYITVLARGQVLAEGPYASVSRNPLVIEAYMGTGHA